MVFKALLQSRKFWLAVVGVVDVVVAHYLSLPPEIWASILALILTVIGGITAEDVALKAAGNLPPLPPEK